MPPPLITPVIPPGGPQLDPTAIYNNFRTQFPSSGPSKYNPELDPVLQNTIADAESKLQFQNDTSNDNVNIENVKRQQALSDAQQNADTAANYTRTTNSAGGYSFADPYGNPVSPFQYATAKNIPVSQALAGSNDPTDIEYLLTNQGVQSDLQQGLYNQQTALNRLAGAFPNIFGLKAPANDNQLQTFRAGIGQQQVQSDLTNLDSSDPYGTNSALTGDMTAIQNSKSYAQAQQLMANALLKQEASGNSATSDAYKAYQSQLAGAINEMYHYQDDSPSQVAASSVGSIF